MKKFPSLPQRTDEMPDSGETPQSNAFVMVLLASYVISGAAAMFYQVGWTRTLSLILGTNTYAFTTMLATFLTGIALGSILYRKLPKTWSRTALYIGIKLFIVLSVLMTIPLFDRLLIYYLSLRSMMLEPWQDLHIIRTLLASMIMFLPSLGMGLLFPIVCDPAPIKVKK